MRIIDNQHDIYDYLQDPTDTLVFDRRNSFLLTKEMLGDKILYIRYHNKSKYRFILLQCGVTYWLYLLTVEYSNNYWYNCISNYKAELLSSWKNYNKPNKLIELGLIEFNSMYGIYNYKINDYDYETIKSRVNDLVNGINNNNFSYDNIGKSYKYNGNTKAELNIPLLKASGLPIDPQEVFCAIEEYFSLEKTASERIDPIGITNKDKIEMHGFDNKTSFRGKNS